MMEIFQREPLLSPPGSRWRYSSPGYVLLGSFDLNTVNLGADDVWSTAGDLIRWDDALAGGELLTPAARESAFAS